MNNYGSYEGLTYPILFKRGMMLGHKQRKYVFDLLTSFPIFSHNWQFVSVLVQFVFINFMCCSNASECSFLFRFIVHQLWKLTHFCCHFSYSLLNVIRTKIGSFTYKILIAMKSLYTFFNNSINSIRNFWRSADYKIFARIG